MKLQNFFAKGTINKDADSRFVDAEQLIDAENFLVNTVDGSSNGVGKNVLGNAIKTAYNITGGKTVGVGKNPSTNKVYNLVKGTNYDYVIEYDAETNNSVIVLQSTTGTRLNFKTGERVRNVDVITNDTGEGNLLSFSGDSNPPRIINIERAKTWGTDGFTTEEIMLIKAPPLYPPFVVLVNTVDENENFLKDKFISFATRYQYKDNYMSAISSWQEIQFTPDRFSLDISSCENKGMINTFNACDIIFNTGPREVKAIELLFRYCNSYTVYKVDRFVKTEEGWGDNINIPSPIRFANNKVFSVLPEDQYFRSFDSVPETVVSATIARNRQMLANYKEGKNMIDSNNNPVIMEYTVDFASVDPEAKDIAVSKLSATSIFNGSSIADGKIRLNFTGVDLEKESAISIRFNIKSIAVSPALSPTRAIFTFNKTYSTILSYNYNNISDLVADNSNGFKSGIEGYLSDLFLSSLVYPADSLGFPPSLFNGFSLTVISSNVIEIVLPSMKYEIEVLPSGPNTFVTEYTQDSATLANVDSIGSKKSMKSYRGYEIIMIYRDTQVRKITAPTSDNNNVFIPISKSASKNILTVDLHSQKPPKWATTYKFAIKESKGNYEEIYITSFYEDGPFRWLRLEGTSKNKVKEGDLLLVKRDSSGVVTKPITVNVLEIKTQTEDFLIGNGLVEPTGLYMKIKPEGFNMVYNPDAYKEYSAFAGTKSGAPSITFTIPNAVGSGNIDIPQNSILTIKIDSNFSNEGEYNSFQTKFIASSDYPNFQTFFNAQISPIPFQGNNTSARYGGIYPKSAPDVNKFRITGTSEGDGNFIGGKSGFLNVKITLQTTDGFVVFETLGEEATDDVTFYETPEVFPIVNGEHVYNGTNVVNGVHTLAKTFNCFSQGNGAESYQIRDAFNEKYLRIDYLPTAAIDDGHKEVLRQTDITYSGVFNASSNVNKLNEFNLFLANFKDDIDKSYGAIYKIKGEETNLQVYQESICSQVFYEKDILYNADGSSALLTTDKVLGNQDLYKGEFGISIHSDSYDNSGFNSYHTDVNKGVVIKKSNNGLFEISKQGMRSYFKTLFRDNTINHINGKYDQFNDFYILNIQYNGDKYVTWVYSDEYDGWLGRLTFNPEDMCCINGKMLSFKNGEIYEHNQLSGRNTFYGEHTPSSFVFNFSQSPSERKVYKNIEIEGTDPWDIELTSDLDKGYILKDDFEKQENVFRAYTRTSNEAIDTSLLSVQGIGNCTISGLVLNFSFDLEDLLSVGDHIRNSTLQLVGTILSKTKNSLTLNTVENIVSGDYVLCSKSQSSESAGILGYHLQVKATLSKNTKTEVFAVNTETAKSYS